MINERISSFLQVMEVVLTSGHLALRAQVEACSQKAQKPVHLYTKQTQIIKSYEAIKNKTNTKKISGGGEHNAMLYIIMDHSILSV